MSRHHRMMGFASLVSLAAISIASSAMAQEGPLRLGTAGEKGNYFYFGSTLAKTLGGSVPITPVVTKGSMDNLEQLSAGKLDAVLAQSDASMVYLSRNSNATLSMSRVGVIFSETLNLVCNKDADISSITDLTEKTKVAVGEVGSGSWVSWQGIVAADKVEGDDQYSAVPISSVSGTRALNQIVDGSDVQCLFFTMSANSDFMARITEVADGGNVLQMAEIDDGDLDDITDSKGKSIYTATKINYPGFGSGGNWDTLKVSAILFVGDKWIEVNSGKFDTLSEAFLPVVSAVKADKGIQ